MKKRSRKSKVPITDDTPVRIGELAEIMRLSKLTIYRDIELGYVFEFATHSMTTPGHYKKWLRHQALERARAGNDGRSREAGT